MAVREHHSHGESYHPAAAPDLVCFPASTGEVSAVLGISQRFQLPVVPFGAGTSLEGHVHALRGGISIDLREMNRVIRVSTEDLDATVEAGVTRKQLNRCASQHRPHVSCRSGRGRDDRWNGIDTRIRHDSGPVRHDARERPRAHRCSGRWPRDTHRHAGEEVGRRLRPDPPVRRIGGHARRHDRSDRPAPSAARGHGRGGLFVRVDSRRCRHGDCHNPARDPHRTHRAAGRSP